MRWLWCILALPLQGATYYVATTGSNANTCVQAQTMTTPKLWVSQGVGCAVPGDTVMILAGTYGNEGIIGDGSGCQSGCASPLPLTRGGTSALPITVRGSDPANPPVLDCQTTTSQMGCDMYFYLQTGANYWTFRYLHIIRGAFGGIAGYGTSSNIQILNCEIDHIGGWNYTGSIGMSAVGGAQTTANWTLDSSSIHDIGRVTNQQLDHGIYAHIQTFTVTNNLFFNNTRGWHIQMANGASNWLIANNTFAFPATNTGPGAIMWWNTLSNITVRNNIFYNQTASTMTEFQASITNCVYDHNLAYPAMGTGVTECVAASSVTGNPNFTNATAAPYNFQVTPPSAAIDAGLNIGQVIHDYVGTTRPQPAGGIYDIGAYEYAPAGACVISPTILGPWTNTQVVSQALTATGCSGTWAMTGAWPANLSGCNSGTAATCTVSGTVNGTVSAHNAILTWQDTVNPAGTTYNVYRASGTCASPSTFTLIASGIMAHTYTDIGVPPGNYCYQVTAVNGGLESGPLSANVTIPVGYTVTVTYGTASNTYAIVVNPVPQVTSTSLPGGAVGISYSQHLATTGGTGALACSLASGSLPANVTLSSGCLISGTPLATGSSSFTVRVTDANSVSTTQALMLAVAGAAPARGINVSGGGSCRGCRF